MKKVILLLLSLSTFAHTESIKIASEVSYPPWNDTDKNGQYVGFELDLYPLICKKAGLECTYHPQPLESIISSIRFKKFDIVISGMTITPYRQRVVDFSIPYGLTPAVFITKKGENISFCGTCAATLDLDKKADNDLLIEEIKTSLAGKKIGVQTGSLTHRYFKEHPQLSGKVKVIQGKTMQELVKSVESGKLDAAYITRSFAMDMIQKNNSNIQIIKPDVMGGAIGRGVGIMFRKTDTELKNKVNKAIEELKQEGVISELSTKWFGFDMLAK